MSKSELNVKFNGWVSADELDGYFFKKGFKFGAELGDNISLAKENKNWSYEDADVCGYIVHFSDYRKVDGRSEFYVTSVTEL